MIKCPNCGSDNQLGVVHCVGCGKILEINDLRPEMETKKEEGNSLASYVIKRTFLLIILLALTAITVGIFWPLTIEKPDEKAKIGNIGPEVKRLAAYKSSRTFKAESVQRYLNNVIRQNAGEPGYITYTPQAVKVSFDKDGFQLTLKSVILDNNLSIYTTMKGTIEVDKDGIKLKTIKGTLGKTPFPAIIGTYLITSFKGALTKNESINKLTTAISKVKFEKDKVTIHTAPKSK